MKSEQYNYNAYSYRIFVCAFLICFVMPSCAQASFLDEVQQHATDLSANEYTRSFTIEKAVTDFEILPQICSLETMFTDEGNTGNYPTIRIRRISKSESIYRPAVDAIYQLGTKNVYEINSYRIIRYAPEVHTIAITITIPKGVKLYIRDASMQTKGVDDAQYTQYRFFAHGLDGAFNRQSEISNCAKNGTLYCVVVPKKTSDGVWCCFHDDDNINGLYYQNGQVVCEKSVVDGKTEYTQYDENGNEVGNDAMPISSLSWKFLEALKYIGYTNQNEGVMLLDDFLSICKMTGVHPVFSVHPETIFLDNSCAGLKEIRTMLEKYELLDKLVLKLSVLNQKYIDILGNDIEAYNLLADNSTFESELIALDNFNVSCRKCIEGAVSILTADRVKKTSDAGISVGAWCYDKNSADNQIIKGLIDIGVTEFTVSKNNSFGLKWFATGADDNPTSIDAIDHTPYTTDRHYDLSGRPVVQPKKGMYIVNYKTVIIK